MNVLLNMQLLSRICLREYTVFFVRIAQSVTKTDNFFIPTYYDDSDGRDTFGSSPQTFELVEGRFKALGCPPLLGSDLPGEMLWNYPLVLFQRDETIQ